MSDTERPRLGRGLAESEYLIVRARQLRVVFGLNLLSLALSSTAFAIALFFRINA